MILMHRDFLLVGNQIQANSLAVSGKENGYLLLIILSINLLERPNPTEGCLQQRTSRELHSFIVIVIGISINRDGPSSSLRLDYKSSKLDSPIKLFDFLSELIISHSPSKDFKSLTMPPTYDPPVGERFNKASKRAKKNAKRKSKRARASLEADKNPKQAISALWGDAEPSQLSDYPNPLTTAMAAKNPRDLALETKSSKSSRGAISGSEREEECKELISMLIRENPQLLECGGSSSDANDVVHEVKTSEHVQQDQAKGTSVTGEDKELAVSSTGPTPLSIEPFEQTFTEHCSMAPETEAPKISFQQRFQPASLAVEITQPPPGTMRTGLPKPIGTKKAIARPEKVRKPPHPNCTKPRVWLADETLTMPMPNYPEPWEAPPPPPDEVPKRLVLTDAAKKILLAQSPNSQIIVHRIDEYGFISFLAPIRAPDGCTLVPEYLVSTSTLCLMGFYMNSVEKIWKRYLSNAENRSMEDSYTLLFYTQRFIEDIYTNATSSLGITDSDKLMEKWSLVTDLKAAIRRDARAKDVANGWRHTIKIANLQQLKAEVMKKVNEKFRALDKLSFEIEKRAARKPVSLTPMGDYLEMKARGMSVCTNQTAEGFAPLARMLEY